MDLFTSQSLVPLVAILILGCVLGFALGSARSLRKRQQLQRELNTQTVAALEGKTRLKKFKHILVDAKRKERLVNLLMRQLRDAKSECADLTALLNSSDRRHYIELARLNMETAEAQQQAKIATSIAQKSRKQIKLLQRTVRPPQTSESTPPTSYGHGDSVPMNVVDQQAPVARHQAVSQVSNGSAQPVGQFKPINEEHLTNPESASSPINAASLTQPVTKSSTLGNSRTAKGNRLAAKRNGKSNVSSLN